jgi:hypothetical protein
MDPASIFFVVGELISPVFSAGPGGQRPEEEGFSPRLLLGCWEERLKETIRRLAFVHYLFDITGFFCCTFFVKKPLIS